MGISTTVTITCDCCGFVVTDDGYESSGYLGKVYCTAKGCAAKVKTGILAGTGLNVLGTAHTVLIIGGVIPNHP